MLSETLEARCFDLMKQATTMTLATSADDVPWATDVYFVNVGFDLCFVSSTNSRHCANLKQNPVCAATVHAQASDWKTIRGLQFEGRAEHSAAAGVLGLLVPYFEKFPFARAVYVGLAEGAGVSKLAVYKLETGTVFYIDNARGFGSKFSCRVADGRPIEAFARI